MNILVAGANGNTGRQIVGLLVEDNHHVRAMVREASQGDEFEELGAEPVVADISSRQNLKLHLQHLPKRYWKYLTEKHD